eukprot:TRINITY_DN18766_c0_g1_i1.p2 TRINITY_DN18766_c0_g1~~TRINITY_DN18766_c0_g1_i1.p2  ORF type:complete len:212 (+),score=41.18 TRINITY_DN18766_c0_g1_i1:17-652(+)
MSVCQTSRESLPTIQGVKGDENAFAEAHVPTAGFYESPGACSECACCGYYPFPRWLSKLFPNAYPYVYPFVRGAPRFSEFASSKKNKKDSAGGDRFESVVRKDSLDPETRTHVEQVEKFDSMEDFENLLATYPHLRSNKDVMQAAIAVSPRALNEASEELRADPELQRQAARVPQPMPLDLRGSYTGEIEGRIHVYFIMHNIDSNDELPEV